MATLSPYSPPASPSLSRRRKSWARRCERYCCSIFTCFPLAFVYTISTWAVWVEAGIGFVSSKESWTGLFTSFLGVALYLLMNWSYFTAVFVAPGSPHDGRRKEVSKNGYSHLPTAEPPPPPNFTSFTVKADGRMRFCKKCQAPKPDRAHHCSTCGRCVLKMDHHCPWLATCVGLRNYKAFLLFLLYTCLFCWLCFAVSASWIYTEILSDRRYTKRIMPINYILLAVISGVFGLVLTGFTLWHVWLSTHGLTTIEKLEKTRYLTPVRQAMQRQIQRQQNHPSHSIGDQLREIHANALPSITRPEEGEIRTPLRTNGGSPESPAHQSLRESYETMELRRERERYEDYLDDVYSAKLPNAFDLGWRRNLLQIFGERPAVWWLPICNSLGDGWQWEPSPEWVAAQGQMVREREVQRQQAGLEQRQGNHYNHFSGGYAVGGGGDGNQSFQNHRYSGSPAYGRSPSLHTNSDGTRLNNLNSSFQNINNENAYSTQPHTQSQIHPHNPQRTSTSLSSPTQTPTPTPSAWNDIPSDMLDAHPRRSTSKRSTERSKSRGSIHSQPQPLVSSATRASRPSSPMKKQQRKNDGWDDWAPE